MSLKIIFGFYLSAYCIHNNCSGQKIQKVESLDAFFASVPLKEGFENCKTFIATTPFLGIDSINFKGIYSSVKPGMKNRFPFPDSVQVKILLGERRKIWQINLPEDYATGICIEAVLGDSKESKKASIKIYSELINNLTHYYFKKIYDEGGNRLLFTKGKNDNFPDCILTRDYSEELKFYYVLLECWKL